MPIAGKTKLLSPEEAAVAFRIASSSSILQISILPIGSTEPEGLAFSHRECLIWQLYQLIATMILFMAVEYILLLRVEALYGGRRPIKWVIRCLYYVEVTCMVVGISVSAHGFVFDSRCGVTDTPSTAVIFGVVTPIFQTLLFFLTFYKFAQAVKEGWGRTPLTVLLIRDGTWAFFVIEVLLALNGILNFTTDYPYSSLMFCWLLSGFSFVGYRVILRLREFGMHPNGREDPTQDLEVCFASRPFSTNDFSCEADSHELDEIRHDVNYET
ncbi:hypothetical protein EYR40_006492 [Pleurotus pulmonarius]|nr:hypothetical protein EYR36_011109 [Pleurotus pulmonarius]KAF4599398.1 hypothetical protein EYR40_006492 [Pleurotus pulmonarius]